MGKTSETDKIYRVKDWDSNFENNRTREMKHMAWIPVPNKQDGDGYIELIDHDNGAAHLGAWIAILQLASKCDPRGTLVRDNGTPHAPRSISRITRIKMNIIDEAITRLCSHDIGWLEVVDNQGFAVAPQEGAGFPQGGDEEQKGTEQNRKEKKKKSEVDQIESMLSDIPERRSAILRTWLQYKKERRKAYKPTGFKALITTLSPLSDAELDAAINKAMANNWEGIHPDTKQTTIPDRTNA